MFAPPAQLDYLLLRGLQRVRGVRGRVRALLVARAQDGALASHYLALFAHRERVARGFLLLFRRRRELFARSRRLVLRPG
eukprot:31280-Pelagococcus_subviridis.AAC.2